jgi:hypothetical protein
MLLILVATALLIWALIESLSSDPNTFIATAADTIVAMIEKQRIAARIGHLSGYWLGSLSS